MSTTPPDDDQLRASGGFCVPLAYDPLAPVNEALRRHAFASFTAARGGIEYTRSPAYVPPTRWQRRRRIVAWKVTLLRERIAYRIAPTLRRHDDWYD